MTCDACREFLLEADRKEIVETLAGGAVPHASHLGACESCRGFAERIVESEVALTAGLAAVQPRGRPEQAVRAAVREAGARRSRSRRRWGWLAGAAALAGLVTIRSVDLRQGPSGLEVATLARAAMSPPVGLEVEPLGDESVAVFETDNPDIVVFWFYQGRGE